MKNTESSLKTETPDTRDVALDVKSDTLSGHCEIVECFEVVKEEKDNFRVTSADQPRRATLDIRVSI